MKKSSNKKSFTLIELLVAVTIFSIGIIAATGLLAASIRGQRTTLVSQELLDQTSFAMEYMSRAFRMATKELNCTNPLDPATCDSSNPPYCLTNQGYGYNYEILDGGSRIKFINHLQNNDCQEFYLEGNRLKYTTGSGDFYLTAEDLKVTTLKFNVSGESQDNNLQPRVSILLEVEKEGPTPEETPKIKIQTSVSQRNLDVQY